MITQAIYLSSVRVHAICLFSMITYTICLFAVPANLSCFPKTSSRRLQDVFSVTLFVFQDLFKTSSRRLQDVFAIRLPEMSSRRLQDVFKTCLQDVLQLCLEDVLEDKKNVTLKTSSVRLHVFSTSSRPPGWNSPCHGEGTCINEKTSTERRS